MRLVQKRIDAQNDALNALIAVAPCDAVEQQAEDADRRRLEGLRSSYYSH